MNENQKQKLAAEWQQRFDKFENESRQYTALNEVQRAVLAAMTFNFFSGIATAKKMLNEGVPESDMPIFLELTSQVALEGFRRAGVDLEAAGILHDTLIQALNQTGQSDTTE